MRNKFLLLILLFGTALAVWSGETSKTRSNWLEKVGDAMPDSKKSADVAGVRGLEDSDEKIVGSEARDYAAMDELEAVQVSDDELRQFMQEGGLK